MDQSENCRVLDILDLLISRDPEFLDISCINKCINGINSGSLDISEI